MQLTVSSHLVPQAASQRRCKAAFGNICGQQAGGNHWLQQSNGRRQQQRRAAALEEELSSSSDAMQQPSTSYSSKEDEEVDESRDFALAMAKIAWETKGEDISVLHVAPVVYWTRYMIIVTVFSRPQLNALLGKMEKEAAEVYGRRLSQSPQAGPGGWELLDYGDVVVQLMTAEQRDYYDLESFYGAAEEVELPFDPNEAAMSAAASWSKKM